MRKKELEKSLSKKVEAIDDENLADGKLEANDPVEIVEKNENENKSDQKNFNEKGFENKIENKTKI